MPTFSFEEAQSKRNFSFEEAQGSSNLAVLPAADAPPNIPPTPEHDTAESVPVAGPPERPFLDTVKSWLAQVGETEMQSQQAQLERQQAASKAVGQTMFRASQVVRAQAADAIERASDISPAAQAERLSGLPYGTFSQQEPQPNLAAFAEEPNQPLPIEADIAQMPGYARIPAKAGLAAAGAVPLIGAAASLTMAGVPPGLANMAVMGLDKEGKIDPVGIVAAAGLPYVDKAGRAFFNLPWVKNAIQQFGPAEVKAMFSRVNAGQGTPAEEEMVKLINAKLGKSKEAIEKGVEISSPRIASAAGEKAAEILFGQAANNIYLLGLQAPHILSSDDPKKALEDAIVGNVAVSLFGAGELHGKGGESAKQTMDRAGVRVPGAEAPSGEAAPAGPALPPKLLPSGAEPAPTPTVPPEPLPAPVPPAPPAPAPPVPAPVVEANGVVLGRETKVRGANDSQFDAHYAWVPENLIQSSHVGEGFSPNPLYAPLQNTRDYEKDLAEREKVLAGARNFDPEAHITDARGAAEGPVMVAQGGDGVYRVVGGNGREQMIRRLSTAKRDALRQVENEKAGYLGLPPRPADNARLVRLLPAQDLSTASGIQAVNRTVDLLNPSAGLIETTSKMAENDAAKVPPEALNLIKPTSSVALMQEWMRRLIADGTLDRNTRTQIAANADQTKDYVERLLVQAAYQDSHISNVRNAPRALETVRGMIDSAVPLLIQLRQGDAPEKGVANSFTEMIRRVADFQTQYPGRRLDLVLKLVADQAELTEPPEVKLARGLAAALAGRVQLGRGSRNEPKVDYDHTMVEFRDLLDKMALAIQHGAEGNDLLGQRDVFSIVSDFIRADLGDANLPGLAETPSYLSHLPLRETQPAPALQLFEANPALQRWRALMKTKDKNGKLDQKQTVELEALERKLGQNFMAFYKEHKAAVAKREAQQAEVEARAKARLVAGPIESQGDLIDNPPQLSLFEGRSEYFPGFDVPVKKVVDDEPKINTAIEGPKAQSERANRQLRLDGLERPGSDARVRGGAAGSRAVITSREGLVPALAAGYLARTIPGTRFANLRVLKPHQIDGVARAILAFHHGKNFGLFDGTGAGKTMQELALAQLVSYFWKEPVLIITERQGIIDDAFAKDAETLKIPLWQYKGGPIEGQNVLVATYFDVQLGKVPLGLFKNIIFDEAHNLRGAGIATKAHIGIRLADAAKRVMFATATPLDKPEQLWYLKSLFTERPELVLARVGIQTQWKTNRHGGLQPVFTVDDHATDQLIEDNLERAFDDVYRRGQGIKREVPLDNLTVNLKRVALAPEALKAVDKLMAEAEQYYRLEKVPEQMIRGLVWMAGRGALESHKALVAIDETDRALKEGKQVILYAYRVERGMWGGGVTGLQALADLLEKKHGVGSVAKLFGGGTSLKDRRYQQQAIAAFNSGRIKILIGTPAQAGTGISLDDVHGDSPRETIVITPPLSALENVQIAGRTNRLTTASKAVMTLLAAHHKVDNWNLDITLRKLRRLQAAVKGDIEQLTPQPINEPTSFQLESRKSKYLDPAQVEFNFNAAVAGLGTAAGKSPVSPVMSVGWPGSARIYARAFREDLAQDGHVSLVGRKIRNAQEFAVAMQACRNPSFENHHWVICAADGTVLQHVITTVRSPNTTYAFPAGENGGYINDLTARVGGAYSLASHNHPSGDPDPSDPDLRFRVTIGEPDYVDQKTGKWMPNPNHVPLLKGYIVIDHGTYVEIFPDGSTSGIQSIPGVTGRDPLLLPEGPLKALLGRKVLGGKEMARFMADATRKDDTVTLAFIHARGGVRAVTTIGLADLRHEDVTKWLRSMALRMGASQALAYYDGPEDLKGIASTMYENGLVAEFLLEGPGGFWSAANDYAVANGGRAYKQSPKFWFGTQTNHADTEKMLMEEGERYNADENADTFETRALSVKGPDPGSGYTKGTPVSKGTTPVKLGGMQHVNPVQMPEILKLAKLLLGDLPKLKKLRGPRGVFYPRGAGLIRLDPSIFRNQIDAAKTLAHELGHLVDYLPDHYIQRGNVLGRLLVLRDFLKNKFGGVNVTNKQLREELLALTKYWKPWDEATSSPHFNAYRKSAVELYADALSVLLNSPGLLEKMCPNFYREFWDHLDAKPEVKAALFNLQDFLDKGMITTLETRAGDIDTMFKRGEEIFQKKAEERELRRSSWKGFWLRLAQTLMDRHAPAISLQKQAEKTGATFAGAHDPRRILDESGLKNNVNHKLMRDVFEKVVKPMEDIGLSQEDLGQVLFLDRILAGDRAVVANPLGQTPETSRLQLAHLQRTLGFGAAGLSRMTLLRSAVQKFHDIIFPIVEQAVECGAYNRDVFNRTIKPNKNFYAAFAVLDYLEDFLPAGLKNQIGTFKAVANPFTATLLKAVAINNLNALQRGKNVVVDDLLTPHFPGEIDKAKTMGFGPTLHPSPPPVGRASLMRLENGQRAWYHVDPMIAEMFEKLTPTEMWPIVRLLDVSFRKIFYPMFITYNPAFMLFLSPLRDFKRTVRNMPPGASSAPGVAEYKMAAEYVRNFVEVRRRYKAAEAGPLTREMEANFAIAPPFDSFGHANRDDFLGDLMRRYKLLPDREQRGIFAAKVFAPARAVLDKVELYGMILDSLPKYSMYRILTRDMGMAPKDAAGWVRNFAGLPNIHAKGLHVAAARAIQPFFNVCLQGWRADARLMTQPTTRGAWWIRWAMRDGFWALMTGLASAGLLGAVLKELFGGVSEYDKTNYQIIPLGKTMGGDFGQRITYLRVPNDETSRLLSGIIYKITSSLASEPHGLPSELLDFGVGQLPNLNPAITVPEKWLEYAEGMNPVDPFKGKPIIGDTAFRAGGIDSLKPMFQWTMNELGVMNFIRWDPNSKNTLELVTSAVPGVNRVLKTSDYGYREAQMAVEKEEQAQRAAIQLKMPDNAQSLLHEYMHIRGIDAEHRTDAQKDRYSDLNVWYSQTYKKADEDIRNAIEDKDLAGAERRRKDLKADSVDFERRK